MNYTFWYAGQLLGTSDLAHPSGRGELAGHFYPTAYGKTMLPQFSGLMTGVARLRAHALSQGIILDENDTQLMDSMFEKTAPGRAIQAISARIVKIEVRDPHDNALQLASLTFSDLAELRVLSKSLGKPLTFDIDELPKDFPTHVVILKPAGVMSASIVKTPSPLTH
jgi:hypothetical protein